MFREDQGLHMFSLIEMSSSLTVEAGKLVYQWPQ